MDGLELKGNMMTKLTELEMLKIWKEEALERMADNDRVIAELEKLVKEQLKCIANCSDALHTANRAIDGYVEIKNEVMKTVHKKRKPSNV